MTNESSLFNLKEVWTSQNSSGITLSREDMEERMQMRKTRLRNVRMGFWISQIVIIFAGAAAANMKSYPWNEVLRLSSLTLWLFLFNSSYTQWSPSRQSPLSLGLDPSVHPLVDSYRDYLSRRHDFYRHTSSFIVPCLLIVFFALPGLLAATVQGRVSNLILVPYGLLFACSLLFYKIRRRIELPRIEREIREVDEYRKWNPAG